MGKAMLQQVGAGNLTSAVWRSLFIQSAWCHKHMQTVGFVYALEPLLRERYPDEAERAGALVRYMKFFNTHPLLAPALLGAVGHHEGEGDGELGEKTMRMLMGPFGGMGDTFFWGALKPLLLLGAGALVLTGHLWAVALAVVLFTVANLVCRVTLLKEGLKRGRSIVLAVQATGLVPWAQRIKLATGALAGWLMIAVVAGGPAAAWGVGTVELGVGAALLAFVVAFAAKREVDPLWMTLGGAAVAVAGSYFI